MDTRFTNEGVALSLIKKATKYEGAENRGIRGKKALHKSLYFLNQTHTLFSFRWADYGPFCGEIQQIADRLVASGNVKVDEIKTKKKGAVIQNLQFSGNDSIEINIPSEIDSNLDEIVRFVAGKSPRDLELLASVHFWAVKQKILFGEYSAGYVFEKLSELKPDARFVLGDVTNAIETLQTHDFLTR